MNNVLRRNIYKNVMLSFAYAATALTVAVFIHEEANNVRADKTSTTGNHYISFHYFICLYKSYSSCFMAVVKY